MDDGLGGCVPHLKKHIPLLIKVFAISKGFGHFIFSLSKVHAEGRLRWWGRLPASTLFCEVVFLMIVIVVIVVVTW